MTGVQPSSAQKWPEANVNSVLSSHNCTTHFSHHFLGTTTMNGNFSISTCWGVFSQIMASLTSLIIVEHYAHKSYHILDFDSYKDYKWWWSFYNRENFGVERAASTSNCRAVRNIKSLLYEEDHGTELFFCNYLDTLILVSFKAQRHVRSKMRSF